MLVADASVVVDALLGQSEDGAGEALRGTDEIAAPYLVDIEVLNSFRRLSQTGQAHSDRVRDALADFSDLAVSRFPHEPFLDRIWELRQNVTAYDAAYIALAEALAIPLVTCDAGQAAAAKPTVEVNLIPPK